MPYFTQETLDFLAGIRANNSKEWFEPRKAFYQEQVFAPLKALGDALFEPYQDMPEMIHKASRIYKDANFPPYLHYRDTLWIYILREVMYWSRSPLLFFEIAPEGARFGFRIGSPAPAFMAYFRSQLESDPAPFLEILHTMEKQGIELTGDEYKRPKPCKNDELLRFFKLKSITAQAELPPGDILFSDALVPRIREVYETVFPLHEYLSELMVSHAVSQAAASAEKSAATEAPVILAPKEDFMW